MQSKSDLVLFSSARVLRFFYTICRFFIDFLLVEGMTFLLWMDAKPVMDNQSLMHLQPQEYSMLLGSTQVHGAQATGGACDAGGTYAS